MVHVERVVEAGFVHRFARRDLGKPRFAEPVGSEGAGVVSAAGAAAAAQALLGRTVGIAGDETFARYRKVEAAGCLPLPAGVTATEGAAWFVNPMTTLGMMDTLQAEGHRALVHTAAASNLGQMLVKLCQREDVPLVNIVRRTGHAETLRAQVSVEPLVVRRPKRGLTIPLPRRDAVEASGATRLTA